MSTREWFVADVGGSHITCAVASTTETPAGRTAKVLSRKSFGIDSHASAVEIMDAWAAACLEVSGNKSVGWTFAMPDPFDYETGLALFENVGKFENLYGVNVRDGLAQRLKLEPAQIKFIHDATSYAVGEWAFGELAGSNRMMVITLGTGVGSGFLINGLPVKTGHSVPINGTIHRDFIDGVPLEDVVSTRAIVARYELVSGDNASVEQITGLARNQDATAIAVLAGAIEALGKALGNRVLSFDADALVIGGSIAKSWDVLEGPFRAGLESSIGSRQIKLAPTTMFDDAPLLGAVYRAQH
ncbi:MAG: hypothetical protein RL556_658 [Actinomycetota bacterium]|jgi:glucokinase